MKTSLPEQYQRINSSKIENSFTQHGTQQEMWDERIVALKLQILNKRIIKVIPNEEYSESSETIR